MKLTSSTNKNKFISSVKKSKLQGIHIHCPEGAVPKDGPSAELLLLLVFIVF